MVPSMRPTRLLLTFLLMALGTTSVEGAPRKGCSVQIAGLESGQPVILIDGAFIPVEERVLFDPQDFQLDRIACWNPTTGEFQPTFLPTEPTVGVTVMLFLTKPLVDSTRAPVEGLLRAQDAHFSQHSRYAQSLEDLVDFGVPEDTMLEFSDLCRLVCGDAWR